MDNPYRSISPLAGTDRSSFCNYLIPPEDLGGSWLFATIGLNEGMSPKQPIPKVDENAIIFASKFPASSRYIVIRFLSQLTYNFRGSVNTHMLLISAGRSVLGPSASGWSMNNWIWERYNRELGRLKMQSNLIRSFVSVLIVFFICYLHGCPQLKSTFNQWRWCILDCFSHLIFFSIFPTDALSKFSCCEIVGKFP